VGTAAFLQGYQAQDSPIYGAERRGAPVSAYTRIAAGPILERGFIAHPSLVILADATLLDDPAARVLEGVREECAVYVNTTRDVERLRARIKDPCRLSALDVTGMALKKFGRVTALSAPLAAVAGRLLGLKIECLHAAIAGELADLEVPGPLVEQNQTLAAVCYESVPLVPVEKSSAEAAGPVDLWFPAYESPTKGTAGITAGANAPLRKTGSWRTFRPTLIPEKCNGCWLCFAYCPDAAIAIDDNDRPIIDYDHCKGCMLCVEECPTHALVAERESEEAPA
jgi:pyruvate ferredoxin oxidoreductase gamma subunit